MNIVRFALAGLAAVMVFASPGVALADWRRAETEHFVIYGDMGEGELREYARKVERFHSMLERFMPQNRKDIVPPKLSIYVTDGMADMRRVWPAIPDTVGGFYSRSYDGIYAVADQRRGNGDRTLFHEYAHHYMFQHLTEAYPGWFVEGFAEYFAPSDMRMGQIRYGLWSDGRLASLANTASWVPMEDVLRSRLRMRSAQQGAAYYAQAWLLTHYMLGSPERNRQLSQYLAAVSRGTDPVEALQQTMGKTPDDLARDMRAYLATGVTTYTLTEALPVADVSVTRMPASADDMLLLNLRASRAVEDGDKAALLASAERSAARYPGDRLAAITLARIQRAVDEPEKARATLDALIASHPDDTEALVLLATTLMDKADDLEGAEASALRREANRSLAVAYEADPLDFRVYRALARNRRGAATYPTDSDVATLESAYALAPQLPANGVDYASALIARERYMEAVVVLTPLANNPHGGDLTELKEQLARARAGAGLDPAVVEDAPPASDVVEPETDEAAED